MENLYNFKKIQVVPSTEDFVNIILSRTQRRTPTVVHRHFKIGRIRTFYMRKVKFAQQNFHEKLTQIITDFPRIEEVHPFFADLLNVLYDKDHFKLALGQINTARNLIDNVSRDYVRLLKFGDSLYRCKQLKRAALGRMVTIMKKQNSSLLYLEQVRQHMARLPSINPNTRTLLICGVPNVGKSSFINKITRADVEVQPYSFTTKSLYVGHTDYQYLRWQVIDTPGILDHPLEERNTIEMQAITALAHIRACILFVVDASESCGTSLEDQISLFNNIKPLFSNKPIVIINNKSDIVKIQDLSPEKRKIFDDLKKNESNVMIKEMSTVSDIGVMDVRNDACEALLNSRVEVKMKGKAIHSVLNRLHVAMPEPRDTKERKPTIPEAVLKKMQNMDVDSDDDDMPKKKTERQIELEMGDDYILDLNKEWDLADPNHKYDIIPDIWNGHNISDFITDDLEARLEQLIEQEEKLLKSGYYDIEQPEIDDKIREIRQIVAVIREKKALMKNERMVDKTQNKPVLGRQTIAKKRERSVSRIKDELGELGIEFSDDDDGTNYRKAAVKKFRQKIKRQRVDSEGRVRSSSRPPRDETGIKDPVKRFKADKMRKKALRPLGLLAKKGEADRSIPNVKPKHLLSGKRKLGKTSRR